MLQTTDRRTQNCRVRSTINDEHYYIIKHRKAFTALIGLFTRANVNGHSRRVFAASIGANQGWQVFARRWKKPVFSMEKNRTGKNSFLPAKIGFCQNIILLQ